MSDLLSLPLPREFFFFFSSLQNARAVLPRPNPIRKQKLHAMPKPGYFDGTEARVVLEPSSFARELAESARGWADANAKRGAEAAAAAASATPLYCRRHSQRPAAATRARRSRAAGSASPSSTRAPPRAPREGSGSAWRSQTKEKEKEEKEEEVGVEKVAAARVASPSN